MKKVSLISGGSGGIGYGIAKSLSERGDSVFITYSNKKSEQQALEMIKSKLIVDAFPLDFLGHSKSSQIENIYNSLERVDILINNSGITRDSLFLFQKEKDFSDVIDVNLLGAYVLTRKLLPKMLLDKKDKSIIFISSTASLNGVVGQTNYCASKAGLVGLMKALSRELAKQLIRVNVVSPGYIETNLTIDLPNKSKIIKQIPSGRMGTITEVGNIVDFLTSPKASYIVGQNIVVDGGLSS